MSMLNVEMALKVEKKHTFCQVWGTVAFQNHFFLYFLSPSEESSKSVKMQDVFCLACGQPKNLNY